MEPQHTPLVDLEQRFFAHQRARNHAPKTLQHYASSFKDFHRFLAETRRPETLASLTTETLRAFSTWLAETPTRVWRGNTRRSAQGIHGRLRDLRAFGRFLEEEEIIDRAPKVALPKLPQEEFRVLTDAQVGQLFACHHLAAPGPQAVRNRALIALMLDTGLRLSEAAGIALPDLDLADQLVLVRGKGNKERRVPFSRGVAELLAAWLRVRGNEEGSLFWLTPNGIYSLFQRIQRETGLAIHPHQIRHTAATEMVRSNADLHTVKRILGHADLSTTERYLSLSYDDLKAKHAAASPFERLRPGMPEPAKPKRRRLTLAGG
ncbi:MAG: tyrosine-type recombinase/integrase [Chloroflexota bacterium]|nr:tyrosine-type recombinase/integrase [Actinomycetota bacterium]MDP9469524.1 tyrosine-type recombinase/integrase [Chloroflexota bacterium]